MADERGPSSHTGENLLFLTDEQLRQGIEAMFFAYRGFTADPDKILVDMAYGRAHHRAIHFINRAPGTTVNNLLGILGVTKQSLNRVLRTLIADGLVKSQVGKADKRERRPGPRKRSKGKAVSAHWRGSYLKNETLSSGKMLPGPNRII